jgi:hypothetical protein
MSFSSLSLDALKAFRAAIDAEISSRSSSVVAPVKVVAEKPKVKRAAGVHALWLGHVIKAHVPEYESFKAAAESKKGVALTFAKQWRADHAEEFAAFAAEHKDKAPEAAEVAEVAEVPSETESEAKAKKERKPWTAEQKASAAAKRAAKKAAAAAV